MLQSMDQPSTRGRPSEIASRSIGLVGGLGVGSTVQVYKALIDICLQRGFSPRLTIAHADVDRVVALAGAGHSRDLATYLAEIIGDLARAGAQLAAIPALTPHICFSDLVEISPIPLVSMLSLTAEEVSRRGLSRVALFGTRTTIESELFGALNDVEVVRLKPNDVALIHEIYDGIVPSGLGRSEQTATLRELAHDLIRREGADAIILAGTELSLLFDADNLDFPAVDCAALLVAALAAAAMPETSPGR